MQPFLKWAGGKRWLTSSWQELFCTEFDRYFEPFLGGGAVYFHLLPENSLISDANSELITTYRAVRDDWVSVVERLELYQEQHSKDFYYAMRESNPSEGIEIASRFLYLNRTCWNGLYRVNLKGKFNVPIGTKTRILLDDDFEKISKHLSTADIRCCDFSDTISKAQSGDFVYVDPPYTIHHNKNGFLKYNQDLFTWEDQIRLKNDIVAAVNRGAKVVVSNAAHESLFDLYKGVGEIFTIDRASVISGNPKSRGKQTEIVVKCF